MHVPSGPRPDPQTRQCKLVFNGHMPGSNWANVMWLFLSGTGEITVANLTKLANDAGTSYGALLMPSLHTSSVLDSVQVVLYSGAEGPIEAIAAKNIPGARTAPALAANAAFAISWKIAAHYRGGHPRTYLCGVTTDVMQTSRSVFASYATEVATKANDLHTALEAITGLGSGVSSVQHGVVSFSVDNEWRPAPLFRRITAAGCDVRIDTQRRRVGRDLPG